MFLVGLLVVSVAGCVSPQTVDQISATPEVEVSEKVSEAEFDTAISQMVLDEDEFNGTFTIGPPDPEKLSDFFALKDVSVNLALRLGSESIETKPLTYFSPTYVADDWLFFNVVELKSSTGSFYLPIDRAEKTEKVGDGSVTEWSMTELSPTQVQDLSNLLEGKEIKFRLTGSGSSAGESVEGFLTDVQIVNLKNGVLISQGLEQGLTIK